MLQDGAILASVVLVLLLPCLADAAEAKPRPAAEAIALHLAALAAGQPLTVTEIGDLATGGRQSFRFTLDKPLVLDLRVPLEAAPFNGTQMNVEINGERLLPYFAFGGDTRYDAVKGKPGLRPPLATLEGRWLLPPALLRKGRNELALWTTGIRPDEALARLGPPPELRIGSFTLRRAEGHSLPTYANTVYYDFNLWPQGYAWRDDKTHMLYLALVGVINGKGMPAIIPSLGGPEASLWALKRQCESYALDWGITHQEFYTIWEFCSKPALWARYLDVDHNPETQSKFHDQTLFPYIVQGDAAAKGADVIYFDAAKYAAALEAPIRALAPYTDFYNFKCEQWGARGAGLGPLGDAFEKLGVNGDDWASNYWEANKAAHDLVLKYNPEEGRVQEMSFWMPDLRHYLYDHALQRQQPMSQVIDILMTHFGRVAFYDYTPDGRLTQEVFHPELQYPGGQFDLSRKAYRGFWQALYNVGYPEDAIDFNRYRLSRTEKDMVRGDPKVNRWSDGRPFDYRAGFDGDELMYNSENGAYVGYCATAPYQYLHGNFAYSLLPVGGGEPRDLHVTSRKSLTDTEDVPVNLYGEWIDGVGHTKRLRTVDPLYGDLFGWTGQEYCNSGDYIDMIGTREPHHRRQPFDANALVRRICYAFVTTGTIVPAYVDRGHDDSLFVKCLVQVFDGKPYIGLYAANFDSKPHDLDATIPIAFPKGTEARVYDDRAWDWERSVKLIGLPPGKEWRYRATVPALGAWLVLIPAEPAVLAQALGLPPPPTPASPVEDAAITGDAAVLRWMPVATGAAHRYVAEVAREAVFRAQDRVFLSEPLQAQAIHVAAGLEAGHRYFWRVRAIDAEGRAGAWSRPRAFIYQWPAYAELYAPKEPLAVPPAPTPAPPPTAVPPEWQRLADQHQLEKIENLAWQGEIFGTGGYMQSPSRAVDGQAFSLWSNDLADQSHPIPADWCVIWPEPMKMGRVMILWLEARAPKAFAIQVSDDAQQWRDLYATDKGAELLTDLKVSAKAKFLRLHITQAAVETGEVGVREIVIQ